MNEEFTKALVEETQIRLFAERVAKVDERAQAILAEKTGLTVNELQYGPNYAKGTVNVEWDVPYPDAAVDPEHYRAMLKYYICETFKKATFQRAEDLPPHLQALIASFEDVSFSIFQVCDPDDVSHWFVDISIHLDVGENMGDTFLEAFLRLRIEGA